ncbi:HD domain-containing protein 2 [Camellia lanceoleosa]|nr:HD domain-containing protein 2 [Camellia lanceoleosa]
MAANPSSLSSSPHCSLPLISPRFHRTSLNLAFFNNDPPSPRLVSVRAQNPSSESGSGPKMASHLDGTEASSSSSAIDFLTLCHRLKYFLSSFSHSNRCIKIAIVHDIAEAIVGDITPSDGVPKQEKSRLEQAALNEMCEVLGGGLRAEEMKELWAEYENNSSIEANLVKDFDKVEMILQALEYEMEHGKVLDEFFLSTAGKFQTEIGKSWAAEIISRRNSRLASSPN